MDFIAKRRTFAILALALAGCSPLAPLVSAAPPVLQRVAVGLGGEYKLGRWAELSLTFDADEPFAGTLGVTVPDGDGVPVEQRSAVSISTGEGTVRVPIRLGRARGDIRVRLYESADADDPLMNQALSLVDASAYKRKPAPLAIPAPRPAEERIVAAFGPESGLEEALRALRSRGRAEADRVYARIDSFSSLPYSRWGYDSVDAVVLTPGDSSNVASVTPAQWQALVDWIELGGSVVFVGGVASEPLLGEQGPLARLAPGVFDRLENLSRLRGLESLAAVEEPLASVDESGALLVVPTAFFREAEGRVISFEGVVPTAGATIVRYPILLGEVVYVAFDLSRPPFAGWVGREGLWREILARDRRAESTPGGESSRRAVHLGYDDLSGQVRTTLERFEGVRLPSFLAIVAVLMLYLAWIGPGDWFFLRRFVGRMEWTWATFVGVLVLMGVGIWLTAGYLRGSSSKWNQLDLVDVVYDDEGNAVVRGYSWSVVYSDEGRKYDLAATAAKLVAENGEPTRVAEGSPTPVVFSWEGLPGNGVGAMSGAGGTALALPKYQLLRDETGNTAVRGVPIPVSSTKAFVGRWSERFQAPPPSELFRSPLNDLLRGTLTNPLPVALEDARVISGTWIYTLGDLGPGETWTLSELDSPMNLEWRLKRRRTTADNRDETETWDPTHASYERLVEILMFHRAAGGRSYSADLGHNYYPQLDLSDRLEYPVAMLIGRIDSPALFVAAEPDAFADPDRRTETWVRIVLPVAPAERSRASAKASTVSSESENDAREAQP